MAKSKKIKKPKPPPGPIKAGLRKYVPWILGLRIPGFFKIHMRYARRSFVTWFVLFIAPFVILVMSLGRTAQMITGSKPSNLQIYVLSFFFIALAFFFAERHRQFRRIYVLLIPALVIGYGLISFAHEPGVFPGNLFRFGILTGLPAWWLYKHAGDKGYKALSDAACKDYRPGRDLYWDGQYPEAFAHLEPSAKRGHMKSLFLLGHAHANGHGRDRDPVLAARFYDKASRKGYRKAGRAFEALVEGFTPDDKARLKIELEISGINELF